MLFQTYPLLKAIRFESGTVLDYTYHFLAYTSYNFIYLLPAILVIFLLMRTSFKNKAYVAAPCAVLLTTICLLLLHLDQVIFDLYNFHLNGFVFNLIFTRGGIDSLGADSTTYAGIALIIMRILLIQILLFLISIQVVNRLQSVRHLWRILLCFFLIASVSERIIYSVSKVRNNSAVINNARVYPFYSKTSLSSFYRKLGFASEHKTGLKAKKDFSHLQYPLQPMIFKEVKNPPNIIWLVAESLRGDCLSPETMPNTWRFAGKAQHFTHHASTGNGTREGMFGMFYGLSSSSWSNFMHSEVSPLIMDRIRALNYQLDIRTSVVFSYPELDRTLFVNIPAAFLHAEEFDGPPWSRDENNTSALIKFIRNRDRSRPFMSFMFYESTHARYTFPDSARIYSPVLENVDYSKMSREKLRPYADQLHNRYKNSSHWIDVQLGRIISMLEGDGLLDNTIVIITGDHGEEFMENGFWGHNSSFVEQQIITPLVVWIPGRKPAVIERTTSHMDIAVTLMQALGAANKTSDYALGRNLFDADPRDYIMVADDQSIGIITSQFKYRIPYGNEALFSRLTHADDRPYSPDEEKSIVAKNQRFFLNVLRDVSRFNR